MGGQLLISSLAMGSIYGLIALAMVLVYKTTKIANFAQGELALVTTYLAYALRAELGLNELWVLALTLLAATLLGLGCHLLLRKRQGVQGSLDSVLLTLGLQFVLQGLVGWHWGPQPLQFSLPLDAISTFRLGALTLGRLEAVSVLVAALIGLALILFFRTSWGTAMRAAQQNAEAARICGVPVTRMQALAWAISAVVGAVAGLLLAPMTSLDPNLMIDPALKGFAAAVLGGMHSLPGALLGGYLLAFLENLFGAYVADDLKTVMAFACILLALAFRPQGLLGGKRGREV